jgi:hypothetical protein
MPRKQAGALRARHASNWRTRSVNLWCLEKITSHLLQQEKYQAHQQNVAVAPADIV